MDRKSNLLASKKIIKKLKRMKKSLKRPRKKWMKSY